MSSIKKRPNGKWRARYRDEAGREHARHFARKTDGERWLDEVTAAMVTGQYADPRAGRIPFDNYYRDWADRQIWVEGTRISYDRAMVTVTFAKTPIRAIRASHIEGWVTWMVDHGYAPSTITLRFGQVQTVFRAAIRDKIIPPTDPCQDVKLPRTRKPESAMRIPTPDQVGVLLGVRTPFRAYMALCAFAGLRRGETAGVQVSDIDLDRQQLHVARQLQRDHKTGGTKTVPPKYGSERTVFLPADLCDLLAEHITTYAPGSDPERWLFNTDGEWWHDNRIVYQWNRNRAGAGLDQFTLHDLRHFYASGLIAAGCDVVTVQRALGHAKPSTTLNTYAHLWPTAEDRTRAAAAGMMTECGLAA